MYNFGWVAFRGPMPQEKHDRLSNVKQSVFSWHTPMYSIFWQWMLSLNWASNLAWAAKAPKVAPELVFKEGIVTTAIWLSKSTKLKFMQTLSFNAKFEFDCKDWASMPNLSLNANIELQCKIWASMQILSFNANFDFEWKRWASMPNLSLNANIELECKYWASMQNLTKRSSQVLEKLLSKESKRVILAPYVNELRSSTLTR